MSTFEDKCSIAVMKSVLNPLALKEITDNMDALNQALYWVEKSELPNTTSQIVTEISEARYNQCISLLTDYAYPYSIICSGYISYSRERLIARVDNDTVTFDFPEDHNNSAWADNSIEPTPGMIIFFDWDSPNGSSGPQDGQADHVGIVEKCENGIVYTVEGNSGDSCRQRQYPVGCYEILGYGIPAY